MGFSKTGIERKMFADFYKLCEKYWDVKSDDKYWEDVTKDAEEFSKTYASGDKFASKISLALIEKLEFEERRNRNESIK